MGLKNLFGRNRSKKEQALIDDGLAKTRSGLWGRLGRVFSGKKALDAETLEAMEEALLTADVGLQTASTLVERFRKRVEREGAQDEAQMYTLLEEEIATMLNERQPEVLEPILHHSDPQNPNRNHPHVVLIVGVNGVGKTTSIGKLAHRLKQSGRNVLLGAADTFRAAAVDQLATWAQRVDVPIVQKGMGADPAAVAYETVQQGLAQGADVILIDTAGRLHTKKPLMDELTKVRRVVAKLLPEAPHDVILVLDATTGQNALQQAKLFSAATQVSALIVTKLDGTARGGVVLGVGEALGLPIRYIGVGEGMEDLQPFDPQAFAHALVAPGR